MLVSESSVDDSPVRGLTVMRTIWQSLAWKEYHEHKWKLASLVCILLGVTAIPMSLVEYDKFHLAFCMLVLCAVPLSMFVGLGEAANERSRGTLPFLQALPVPMRQVALTKLVAGLLTVVLPVVLAACSIYVWHRIFNALGIIYKDTLPKHGIGGIDTGSLYFDLTIICVVIAASVLIWFATVGMNRKDEISAGAVALATILGWMVAFGIASTWGSYLAGLNENLRIWLTAIALSPMPGGWPMLSLNGMASGIQHFTAALITLITYLVLAWLYVRRFGRISEREVVSPQAVSRDARRNDWLAPPRRLPLTAIAWKQFRESGPIAMVGLVGMVGILLFLTVTSNLIAQLAEAYFGLLIPLGSVIALVIGIGVALHDSGPQLNLFWRSRPIKADLWIGVKFVTGLGIVLLSLYTPLLLLLGWGALRWNAVDRINLHGTHLLPALHVAVFAAAVAMTCLVRHATYAAILSIGVLSVSIYVAWLARIAAGMLGMPRLPVKKLPWRSLNPFDEPHVIFVAMVMCFILSTLIAWLAVRYDWGRKSRY